MSTYKRPQILEKQLKEILRQEYRNIEIVVSDNDPEASAKDIVANLSDPRVRYFHNEQNLGMVKSFNKSIERSRGQYIIMVTDDDPVYTDLVATLVKLRTKHPGYGIYAGCADWIVETDFSAGSLNEKKGAKSTLVADMPKDEVLLIEAKDLAATYMEGRLSKTFILWSCCMVERMVVMDIGGMPDYGSELLTDHTYILAGGSKKGMAYINRSLGGQSVRGDNFGYDFERNKAKYISTPRSVFNFLQPHIWNADMGAKEKKLWTFIGRAWVEYSLMIFRSLKLKGESTRSFFSSFHEVFSDPNLRKWKYKFYLKAYFNPLFRLLLKLRGR